MSQFMPKEYSNIKQPFHTLCKNIILSFIVVLYEHSPAEFTRATQLRLDSI